MYVFQLSATHIWFRGKSTQRVTDLLQHEEPFFTVNFKSYYLHYTGGPTRSLERKLTKVSANCWLGWDSNWALMTWCPVLFLYDTTTASGKVKTWDWQSWFSWGPWGGRLCKVFNTSIFGLSIALMIWLALWPFHPMSEGEVDGNTTFKHWKPLVSFNYCLSTLYNFVMN